MLGSEYVTIYRNPTKPYHSIDSRSYDETVAKKTASFVDYVVKTTIRLKVVKIETPNAEERQRLSSQAPGAKQSAIGE